MITFKSIDISDREWISSRLEASGYYGCEYTFANNYIWGPEYKLQYAEVEGFYCPRCGEGNEWSYGYPVGEGEVCRVIDLLVEDAKNANITFVFRGLFKEQVDFLMEKYPGQYEFENIRDDAEYIYEVERLSTLAGKKLHGKRNHIARFKDNENWVYEDITQENIEECLNMNRQWCKEYNCSQDASLRHEFCAVKRAFENFKELHLVGGLLRLNGKVIAFTVGSKINEKILDVHIEKAFADIQGAYPMINQQFVQHACQDYQYVNREEDLGEEGLRKAKLSYYPDILLEKYTAKRIADL